MFSIFSFYKDRETEREGSINGKAGPLQNSFGVDMTEHL